MSDNNSVQPAECKIAGCDAYGNVYAVGMVNGPNMRFDTFSSSGSYSGTNTNASYLLFSHDCSGHMRWAKQIGDQWGNFIWYGAVTDPQGNTYFAGSFDYGPGIALYLGDTVLRPSLPMFAQKYLCMVKYDSLGKLLWFRNYENDTVYNDQHNYPYGLHIGSSGNIWMFCALDSNYAISPNLHTTKKGLYNMEVSPLTGNILSGYYTSNKTYGNAYDVDTYYDLDENESYYSTGTLRGDFGAGGDTLILTSQRIAPDTHQTYVKPYIFSLDKHGNFRYVISNKSYSNNGTFSSCKYDFQSKRLVTCWSLDPGNVYGTDTFNFNPSNVGGPSEGLFAIDANGNILWGKYLTTFTGNYGYVFSHAPTPFYSDHIFSNGLAIYNNSDTLFNKSLALPSTDYTKVISRIDQNGKMTAIHTAHLGTTGSYTGYNMIKYGATDWRGNVYLGGTVTNFFATPADSVVNTDHTSGNFFIAKLGTSDCSCPTPGAQFTQIVKGDTVYFSGSSTNHRDSIHWRFGDGTFATTDTFMHVYSQNGTYNVTAIAYSGCGIDSITKQITVRNVGIAVVDPDKTNLYPNPVKNTVNLEVSGAARIGLVLANGASVWDGPMQVNQQGTYVFDMSKYSSALYYFIVEYTNGKVDVMQVVKE